MNAPNSLHDFLMDWDMRARLADLERHITAAREKGYVVSEPVHAMARIDNAMMPCWRVTTTTPGGTSCDVVIPIKKRGT